MNRRRFMVIATALGLAPRLNEAKQSPRKVRRKMRRRAYRQQARQNAEATRLGIARVEACRSRTPGYMACYADAYRCCDALQATNATQADNLYCSCLARIADPYCLQCSAYWTEEPPPRPTAA